MKCGWFYQQHRHLTLHIFSQRHSIEKSPYHIKVHYLIHVVKKASKNKCLHYQMLNQASIKQWNAFFSVLCGYIVGMKTVRI